MSPVKVNRDGQMVERGSYTTIHMVGHVLEDDTVDPGLLEIVKAGEVPGLTYFDDAEEAREAPILGVEPEAKPPQSDRLAPDPANDPDDLYDPSEHNQAQVLEYLKTASAEEVERVQKLESGKQNRQQIAQFRVGSE